MRRRWVSFLLGDPRRTLWVVVGLAAIVFIVNPHWFGALLARAIAAVWQPLLTITIFIFLIGWAMGRLRGKKGGKKGG